MADININERIRAAVTPKVAECWPDKYAGEAEEYCVFNVDTYGELYGDDSAEIVRHVIQLHYFAKHKINTIAKRKGIRSALDAAGFTFPAIIDSCEDDWQHWIFEFEYYEAP